jgi:ELWxxDGT repeat protein
VVVRDIVPGSGSSSPGRLTAWGDRLLFEASDGVSGSEPWLSDGTSNGTVMIKDVRPGSGGSSTDQFAAVSSRRFWFRANDGTNGSELWSSDGSTAGTAMVSDLHPTGDGFPDDLTLCCGELLLVADDGWIGRELWKLNPGATAEPFGLGCGKGPRTPSFRGSDPAIGTTMTLSGHDAMPLSAGIVLLGLEGAAPIPLGFGCRLYLAPSPLITLLAVGIGGSSWSVGLPIPNDASLIGGKAALQTLMAPTDGGLGFDLTNGLRLVFGL